MGKRLVVCYFLPYSALVVDGVIPFGWSEGGESFDLWAVGDVPVVMGGYFGLGFESDDLVAGDVYVMLVGVIMGDPELFGKHSRLFYIHYTRLK